MARIKFIRIILQRYYNRIDNQRKKEMKNTPNDVSVKQKETMYTRQITIEPTNRY